MPRPYSCECCRITFHERAGSICPHCVERLKKLEGLRIKLCLKFPTLGFTGALELAERAMKKLLG